MPLDPVISQIDDLNYEEDEQLRMERRKKVLELGKYLIMNRHTSVRWKSWRTGLSEISGKCPLNRGNAG